MVNETLQWTAIIVVGVLLIGVLRQVSLALPPPARRTSAPGPSVGDRLPSVVLRELLKRLPSAPVGDWYVAFVTEGCVGCERLLSDVETRTANDEDLILVANKPSRHFRRALTELEVPVIEDQSGDLWKASGVTATPLVVRVDPQGRVVAKGVTHRVDSIAAPSG